MEIIGLWVALIGYTVVWAGLANWSGSNVTLPEAFTGQGATSTPSTTSQTSPLTDSNPLDSNGVNVNPPAGLTTGSGGGPKPWAVAA